MWHTFGYKNSTILMAPKVWSDFSATLPLIRSFSWGRNWPPEYPLFPSEPIRYHFLFYFLVGTLEKLGVRLDWALNLPSALGFFGLMVIIYLLGKLLFKSRAVGFLGVIFFLFNGSLSFLEFFRQHPLSIHTLRDITTNLVFPSFGPYDGKIVSAFWNLNIYTNQRHLAAAYAGALLFVYLLIKSVLINKKISSQQVLLMGFIWGLYPFFHKAVFLIIGLILVWFWLVFPKLRRPVFFILLIGSLLALPQIIYQMGYQLQQQSIQSAIMFNPGYLIDKPLNFEKIFYYWWLNLGLGLFLIPLGFLMAPKIARRVFFVFLFSFLAGSLFQFTPDIAGNHKFFNFFIIGGNLFTAWAIAFFWRKIKLARILIPLAIFFLILSGIIDLFPIFREPIGKTADAPINPDILWIKKNTPPDAVFLNSNFFNPVNLSGRKIFFGWPYFSWGVGYDTFARDKTREFLLNPSDFKTFCHTAKNNDLDYLILNKNEQMAEINLVLNKDFFEQNLIEVYENSENGYTIYSILKSCPILIKQ